MGSLLWPDDEAAVVGGNVLTSQRVCDVILKAFGACADSQVGKGFVKFIVIGSSFDNIFFS